MQSSIDFPGIDGFLGTRASLMLDTVFVAMFFVIAMMAWSIYQVRYRKRYALHKRIQLVLAIVLLVAVIAFETEMRLYGWEERATGSLGGSANPAVWTALYVHLVFAISTAALWPMVIYRALRQFPARPMPDNHSSSHIFWARIAAVDMVCTSVSGWAFYSFAFLDDLEVMRHAL